MRPWLVVAVHPTLNGPVNCVAALHELPPLLEEMNPTLSWQLLPQAEFV
jgi:hypothetical protein